MDLNGQHILIIGLGKTGIATARFLAKQNARIIVTDQKGASDIALALIEIKNEGIPFDIAAYNMSALCDIDMVIPSPGVPPHDPLLMEAVQENIPIHSELEIACRFLTPPMVAITGTNGKTTTTTLTGELLKGAGKKVFVGGNIGIPLIEYCAGPQDDDFVVVEVSSFQLQWVTAFHARCAALLNTTCDHVNYHGSFAAYREAKERVFLNQDENDMAILNADEDYTADLAKRLRSRTLFFSSTRDVAQGFSLHGDQLVLSGYGDEDEFYPSDMIKIPGLHNIENVMTAIMAARMCGCPPDGIIKTIASFRGISHRIEFIAEKQGVAYYDDSKGTNVGAVVRALETFHNPVILLLGGRDKDGDFETLEPLIRERVKSLILFGEARERINEKVGGLVETDIRPTLREATLEAHHRAQMGDVVLLSPGCASFDEFTDYKDRGNFFQSLVRKL
ncbi:MAG: UDP-N-acetylmuramoyl-L-alanine--D-glutamate ligase [Syntrophaceae bacterium]|nr:UDP-N-acetylmuramoyl-L-alanine--D-glutamate ligase [Syntrophaceae bacterium]